MALNRLQKTSIRILLTVLTAAMMALIFFFSTESAERSDRTSGGISMAVISVLHPEYDSCTPEEQLDIYNSVQYYVRKTAHFLEYMILGVLVRLCLESWFGKRSFVDPASWATGTVYACTDEFHQLLTDGRSGLWTDVLLDSLGVLIGVIIVLLIHICCEEKGTEKPCP